MRPRYATSERARCATASRVPQTTVHDGRRTCGSLLADLDMMQLGDSLA
jgi:hypothetical protein